MSKIAIIGSRSFLAKYLIKRFLADHELFLYGRTFDPTHLNKNNLKYIPFNYPGITLDFKELLNYNVIIYTAAAGVQSSRNEPNLLIYQTNFYLPLELVNYLNDHEYKGRLITFGSYFEIGSNNEKRSFYEDEVVHARGSIPNIYCDSKRLLSRYYSNKLFNINWIHLIIPSLYGLGEEEHRLIPYIINGLKLGSKLKLSSGEQVRQYLFVEDLVDLISLLIYSSISSDIYNATGSDGPVKINDLISNICQLMRVERPVSDQISTRDQNMAYLGLNSEKIKNVLPSWAPRVNLNEGLRYYLPKGN